MRIKTVFKNNSICIFSFIIVTVMFSISSTAQTNKPQTPQFENAKPVNTNSNNNYFPNIPQTTQQDDNNFYQRQKESYRQVQEVLEEERIDKQKRSLKIYTTPDFSSSEFLSKTISYEIAYNELKNMLEGKKDLSLKKAVYVVENAYFNNKMDYQKYDNAVKNLVNLVKIQLQQNKFKLSNSLAVNLMIQKVMFDTTSYRIQNNEKIRYHYPLRYDFDDFMGEQDWTKMFVSKLLASEKGQCHSMPLLYLILADELKTKAYLALSPNHTYVKFKDKNGILYNFEATNGCIVSDKWILGSNYINSMAVKNKIFMDTLSTKECIANMLNDLAKGYESKFGFANGKFIQKCADLSLQHFPNRNINALMIKSNTYLKVFYARMQQKGIKSPEFFSKFDEEGKTIWNLHDKYWLQVQNSGYKVMPQNAYEEWLKSVEKEKAKPENQDTYIRIENSIKY